MLNLPADAKGNMPNCGLTAMAVACNITLEEATQAYQKACCDVFGKAMQGNWKGRTYGNIRHKAMVDYIGTELEEIDFKKPCNLRNLAYTLEKDTKYIITTTGHVQVIENDSVIDQRGVVNIKDYWGAGKKVKSVLKVIDKQDEEPMMTVEERKRKVEESKQLQIMQDVMNSLDVAITQDDTYKEREYTLEMMLEELKGYFGEDV